MVDQLWTLNNTVSLGASVCIFLDLNFAATSKVMCTIPKNPGRSSGRSRVVFHYLRRGFLDH